MTFFDYYQSQILSQNNFIHAFFTKESSEFKLETLASKFTNNSYSNISIKQIHSKNIVYTSQLINKKSIKADGLIGDLNKQNLWIYTADCMPILFADKKNKRIAAIHCGRKGLEKNIIPKLINKLELMGSLRKDILVAIGPCISGNNYLLDKKTYRRFHKNFKFKNILLSESFTKNNIKNLYKLIDNEFSNLDIKEYAFFQLICENIKPANIDIFNKCTFDLKNEFHSWRRSKNQSRQWTMISF